MTCSVADDSGGGAAGGPGASNPGGGEAGGPSGPRESNPDFIRAEHLINPITGTHTTGDGIGMVAAVANNVIKTLLGLTGVFALIGFIWGGVTWMTAYGDTGKIDRGRRMMIWGAVGLIVIFSSYAIANYIFEAIGATSTDIDSDFGELIGTF